MDPTDSSVDAIVIRGAREHNLKSLDLELPRDRLVVITGLSGSGKSSLAFDTIYAEGQRRYVESLSTYARQFLEQMGKPDVDSIEGLSPAISIEQKSSSKNPRSTVGTVTEIYDYLRLLYARIGVVYCWNCGERIAAQSVSQMVDRIIALPVGTRFSVLGPIVRDRKGEYRKELADLKAQGFVRVNVDGELHELSDVIKLDKNKKHTIEVYVDRLVIKEPREAMRQRLTDSVELGLKLAGGVVKVAPVEGEDITFSQKFACIHCGISYPELQPRMFSFNNPQGACPACDGLGARMFFDADLVIPDEELSLAGGAVAPWARSSAVYGGLLEGLAEHFDVDMSTPWRELPENVKKIVIHGSGEQLLPVHYEKGGRRHSFKRPFEGVLPNLERRLAEAEARRKEKEDEAEREAPSASEDDLHEFMSQTPCEECGGTRLRKEARFVKVGGRALHELAALPIREVARFFTALAPSARELLIAERILREIGDRLGFLVNVGLDYLTLERTAASLSGGEGQRIRLATQIGSSLVGVLYILDEPSIGLHQRDNQRLIETMRRLRDLGNTVIVVEHDEETIRAADHVVDMGPRAGVHGGRIVASGTPEEIMASPDSLTGAYLSGKKCIEVPAARRAAKEWITIRGARGHNLRSVTARFPIGALTCVTGVSGSGKSTLVIDTLWRSLAQQLYRSKTPAAEHDAIEGLALIDKVIDIDQSPIGRTPRSNPATYTGLFSHVRDLFSALPESKTRGYKPGRYSFNVKGGRCEACQGDGVLRIEMHFLPDVYVECETCAGRRYNRETLEVRYKGASIADVLDMTVSTAVDFLAHVPKIRSKLETLRDVGLGYVRLGQAATTLSGGEAQRIKLSRELARRGTGKTVYILDEPTTGLHFDDIRQLLAVLNQLVNQGNTVIVIEHNLDVIKTADHVIDLGPEGGEGGGRIVAAGTPAEVARVRESYTGQYLRKVL